MESSQFTEMEELYSTCGLIGFDIQYQFMERLKNFQNWNIDLDKRLIRFEDEASVSIDLPIQILGSFNSESYKFHWAWEDSNKENSDFFEYANRIKGLGEGRGIATFAESPTQLSDQFSWHHLALTAVGLVRCSGYFASENASGAQVYLIDFSAFNQAYEKPSLERLLSIFPSFCKKSENRVQAVALKAYARVANLKVEDQTAGLKLTDESGNSKVALFGHNLEWIDFI